MNKIKIEKQKNHEYSMIIATYKVDRRKTDSPEDRPESPEDWPVEKQASAAVKARFRS